MEIINQKSTFQINKSLEFRQRFYVFFHVIDINMIFGQPQRQTKKFVLHFLSFGQSHFPNGWKHYVIACLLNIINKFCLVFNIDNHSDTFQVNKKLQIFIIIYMFMMGKKLRRNEKAWRGWEWVSRKFEKI